MITNVSLTTVWCLDIQAARDFYVDVLGFVPNTDVQLNGYRWLTVNHPDQPELELHLNVPGPPLSEAAAAFIRTQLEKGESFGVGLAVDDCRTTFEELSAQGVQFLQEPADRPYGVEAVMRDNQGNWLVLVEQKPFSPDDLES